MSTSQTAESVGVRPLPPYRSMLVVDMKDYSGATSRQQAQLNGMIPEILQSAFARCGLETIWDEATFSSHTGDGYAIGLPTARLPFLLNPYLDSLQSELTDRSKLLAAAGFEPIRMRVSIAVGSVTDSGLNTVSDGVGASRIELHRLLDSEPVRELLARSGESTRVAAIVSARAYEDAVASGYSDEDPALYVEAPVKVKRYQAPAYLRVPVPSGDLLTHGFRKSAEPASAEPGPAVPAQSKSSAPVQPAVQQNDYSTNRRGGIGSISGTGHSIISDPTGPMNTGTGSQYVNSRPDPDGSR